MTLRPILRFLIGVWLLISLNFILIRALPGSPLDRLENLNPIVTQKLIQQFGLESSLISQYVLYFKNIIMGDLGPSISFPGTSVQSLILQHLSVTAGLNFLALGFVFLICLLFVWGLQKNPHGVVSKIFYGLSLIVISAPSILLAPLVILIFSVYLGWIPAAFLSSVGHYFMPALILALRPAVYLSRSVIVIMEDEINKDYVRTAKAKGLSENLIIFRHVLKNSLAPIFGLLAPLCVGILSGSAFIEILFAIPGLGHLFVNSLQERDYFVSSGLVLCFGALLIFLSGFFEVISRRIDRRLESLS